MKPTPKRCAVYTRKSSEEGLDQAFNSLDAQREAGEAYIKSQAHEGWKLVPTAYDDGGFSGGSMERPGLKRLLADIAARRIDVVVVYKIDRLTRSLADFARMVELFDAHGVSFISVTQSFNTTSSMGRLTLNVLLSFAQFEREVTGERIRDKIAASKAKGMWMGGTLPLGYDAPTDTSRALVVNEAEAETVRAIFTAYRDLGSVHALERYLHQNYIRSKARITRAGQAIGGLPFSRGALFHLLRNRLYRGQIVHKGTVHQGAHEAIMDEALFDAVQAQLDANQRRFSAAKATSSPTSPDRARCGRAVLTGRIFDADGHPMSPTFSRGASKRLYRYYVSAPLQQGTQLDRSAPRRVSAVQIEGAVNKLLERLLPNEDDPQRHIERLELHRTALHILLPASLRHRIKTGDAQVVIERDNARADTIRIIAPFVVRGHDANIAKAAHAGSAPTHDDALIKALRRAHALLTPHPDGQPFVEAAPASPYQRRQVGLAFLAPDIQRAILAGTQPADLTLEKLMHMKLPLAWDEQRALLMGSTSA